MIWMNWKILLICSVSITRASAFSADSTECKTLNHQQCQFPFEYNNKIYTGCTDDYDEGRFWCKTRTYTLSSGEDWDYCGSHCPVSGRGRDNIGTVGCKEGEICMDKASCPEYKRFINTKGAMTKLQRKNEIRKLKDKICNKKPDRLCSKVEENWSPSNIQNKPSQKSCVGKKKSYPTSFLPPYSQCGLSCSGSKSVVHGEDAVLGEYPWAALIGSKVILNNYDNQKKKWFEKVYSVYGCGGTLINTWFVLTAAHCQSEESQIFEVVLGEWNVLTNPDCASDDENCDNPKVQKKKVSDVIIHTRYDKSTNVNDIALVKMKSEVVLNRFVQLACLPLSEYNLPTFFFNSEMQNATVIGWGKTSKDSHMVKLQHGLVSHKLQKASVPIQNNDQCEELDTQKPITDAQLCAGGRLTDSCKGDSGGGLFLDSGDYPGQSEGNVHVLVGLVSYGPFLCGDEPAVYTRVDRFIPWIKENLV